MKAYEEEVEELVREYDDANDTEIFGYEERMSMTASTKEHMNDVAERYGKTYSEVLADVRTIVRSRRK